MVPPYHQEHTESGLASILSGVLALSDEPSVVTSDSEEIVSCNTAWPWEQLEQSATHPTLQASLDGFQGVDHLVDAIRSGSRSGSETVAGVAGIVSGAVPPRHYEAHWRHFVSGPDGPGYTAIVLRPSRGEETSQLRIGSEHLIVRQALIEEAERLRIGRQLHDMVVQDLAWIRSEYVSRAGVDAKDDGCVSTIDKLIDRVRTLSFELSPPILSDLGLVAALHWLGEHIGDRYDTEISVADDDKEPSLSQSAKTIVFRCVRELTINAAKHASGGEIILSSRSTAEEAIVRVRDFGPGFDAVRVCSANEENAGFGLISVEQQIRGIGGKFELISEVGSGTRATIRVPLLLHKGDSSG